jgi:hypothetical protein
VLAVVAGLERRAAPAPAGDVAALVAEARALVARHAKRFAAADARDDRGWILGADVERGLAAVADRLAAALAAAGEPTLGTLINARATAGARMVDAYDALRRAKTDGERVHLAIMCKSASEAYDEAKAAERTAAGKDGDRG